MLENRPGTHRLGLASISQSDPAPGDERKVSPSHPQQSLARKGGKRVSAAMTLLPPLLLLVPRGNCLLGLLLPQGPIPDLQRVRGQSSDRPHKNVLCTYKQHS